MLFEDTRWADLAPLTDLRPVPALVFGASDLATRLRAATGLPLLAIAARADVMAAWADAPVADPAARDADEVVALNAAMLPGSWIGEALATAGPALWLAGDAVAGARLTRKQIEPGLARGEDFEPWLRSCGLAARPVEAIRLARPWDLVTHATDAIASDLAGLTGVVRGAVDPRAVLIEPQRIAVAAGARIDPLAVLDARDGPIAIGKDVVILPHTVVQGPCVVGAGTHLLGGFVGHSTIGPGCRIAGEVDTCVWQGWSNKRHHGFVGHSVVGEWVNLGALTTTSDLKNNYGEVRVRMGDREIATGTTKVGSILGDHVKTGIGTLLPTGAVIGSGANLFGGGRFAPKHVPAFTWWDGERSVEHELERFLATARIALSRRGRELSDDTTRRLRALHAATAQDRRGSTP
jgi:UDP-N-acetylglucosamine diphosphorylase / glucose-1-phosphate thymidylyltransferase / UDP-N-acetylgalactosamine diphosphorylase / glucosamine-1-phosphate N-acetyltransferase / galactosamine-1-phosphate N-acetyltransferase